MKPLLACLAVLGIPAGLLLAQKFDINAPQSPAKPTPQWVKIIDQGTTDPRLKGYFTPEGLQVEIVAEFPTVVNPVGMAFADDGTLLVLEWRPGDTKEVSETITYKDGSTRQVAAVKKTVKDVVKALQFNAGKGVYDQAKVILEDELPSGLLVHDGWLYTSGRGTVRRHKPSQEGGPYDIREVIARGFGGFHHQQVSGLTIGPDGWLYITTGSGDNHVEGSDGSRATVLRTGAVFRCRPDGSRMQVYSIGYCNPYRDGAFDTAGNFFQVDNDRADGGKFTGCRLMHVAEASDFGWRTLAGTPRGRPDPVRAAVFGELPGKMAPLLKTGRGAAAGLFIYNDTRFSEPYQGLLYYPDVARKLIRAYRVEPYGATFTVASEFEFLKSDDPLFRPCQMAVGPDGAMYVCDWRTDSNGAGQLSGDGKHGRIYRLRWTGTAADPARPLRGMDSWAKIQRLAEEELLQALASDDWSDRLRVQRELARQGATNRSALFKIMRNGDNPRGARIAAAGAVQALWHDEVRDVFLVLLGDGDPDLRRLAADALAQNCKPGDRPAAAALLKALGDTHPAAKRAIVLAMGRIGGDGAADALINALKFDHEKDPYLRDGLIRAIERLGKPGMEKLIGLAESGVREDRASALEAFHGLRTRAAADALPALLAYPHNDLREKVGLIQSYNNYLLDPPVSLAPLVDYLSKHPDEPAAVRTAALQVLASGGQLKGEKLEAMVVALLDDGDQKIQEQAVVLLGAKPAGAKLAAERFLAGKLPKVLLPQVVETLRQHADKNAELAKLLSELEKVGK